MLRNQTILKSIAWLFLLLVLHASFLAVYPTPIEKAEKQPITATEQSSDQPTLSETLPFDALIQVAWQCEFHKIVLDIPQFIVAFFATTPKERLTNAANWSVFLLSYFQNIFNSAILINAP